MTFYEGLKTRRLPNDELSKLTIEEDGVEIFSKPLFTPKQCEYIWNETESFVLESEKSLEKFNTLPVNNGYRIPNDHNMFNILGLPTVAFLVIEEMAKIFADFLQHKCIQNSSRVVKMVSSIEGFYFQREEDTIPYTCHFDINKTSSPIIRGMIQITPNQLEKSCFSAVIGSHKSSIDKDITEKKPHDTLSMSQIESIVQQNDKMIDFDNDTLLPGQAILFRSDMLHAFKHVNSCKRLVFFVTCWQKPCSGYQLPMLKSRFNIPVSKNNTTNVRSYFKKDRTGCYEMNSLYHYDNIVNYKNQSPQNKLCIRNNMRRYSFPLIDSDKLARLFGFEGLHGIGKKYKSLSNIRMIESVFMNTRHPSKQLPQVREELYETYNNTKRKLDFSPIEYIEPPYKKQSIQSGTESSTESINNTSDTDIDEDIPSTSSNTITSTDGQSHSEINTFEPLNSTIPTTRSLLEHKNCSHSKIRILRKDLYTALITFHQHVHSEIFSSLITKLEKQMPAYLNNTLEYRLNDINTTIQITNDKKMTPRSLCLKFFRNKNTDEDAILECNMTEDSQMMVTCFERILEILENNDTLHSDSQLGIYTPMIEIQCNSSRWALSESIVIICPNMDFSEQRVYMSLRTFENNNEKILISVDDLIDQTLEKMEFENIDLKDVYYTCNQQRYRQIVF